MSATTQATAASFRNKIMGMVQKITPDESEIEAIDVVLTLCQNQANELITRWNDYVANADVPAELKLSGYDAVMGVIDSYKSVGGTLNFMKDPGRPFAEMFSAFDDALIEIARNQAQNDSENQVQNNQNQAQDDADVTERARRLYREKATYTTQREFDENSDLGNGRPGALDV